MVRLFILLGAFPFLPAPVHGATITFGEVRAGEAMVLADRLLPPDIRNRIVSRRIRPPSSGRPQQHVASYLAAAEPAGTDICVRSRFEVELGTNTQTAADDTSLSVGPLHRLEDRAVTFPSDRATSEVCAATKHFIGTRWNAEGSRLFEGYAALIRAMRAAKGKGKLGLTVTCPGLLKPVCPDARAALAGLPLEKIAFITVSQHGRTVGVGDPLVPGAPWGFNIVFDRSGPDGHSWTASWAEGGASPTAIKLSRQWMTFH